MNLRNRKYEISISHNYQNTRCKIPPNCFGGTKLFANKETFKEELTAVLTRRELKRISLKNAWMAILTELVYARRRTSLVSLGRIKFEYIGNSDKIVTALSKKYNLDTKICKETLDYLALTFAYFGALQIDDDIIDKIMQTDSIAFFGEQN